MDTRHGAANINGESKQLLQTGKGFKVCREPVHGVNVRDVQPLGSLVLEQLKMSGNDVAQIVVHSQMEARVIVLHRTDEAVHGNPGSGT